MIERRRFVTGLFVLTAVVGSGCGGVPYHVSAQTGQPPRGLAIQAAPLVFAPSANLEEQGAEREDAKTWAEHTAAWASKYERRLVAHGKKKGVTVQPGTQPPVLRATVISIDKNNATYMGRDHVVADVQLVDAANAVLWSARVEASSRGTGPAGYTFGGRIGWACETLANGVVEMLAGQPAEGSLAAAQ